MGEPQSCRQFWGCALDIRARREEHARVGWRASPAFVFVTARSGIPKFAPGPPAVRARPSAVNRRSASARSHVFSRILQDLDPPLPQAGLDRPIISSELEGRFGKWAGRKQFYVSCPILQEQLVDPLNEQGMRGQIVRQAARNLADVLHKKQPRRLGKAKRLL